MAKFRTTLEAAAAIGIDRATVQEWIREDRITPPPLSFRNGRSIRLWSTRDVKQLREVKARTYRRGRGRKKLSPTPMLAPSKKRDDAPDPQALLNFRDYFLSLLAQGWGDIGQGLTRASTVKELRLALHPLLDIGPYSYRFPPFLREETQAASRTQLGKTRDRLRVLTEHRSRVLSGLQSAKDDLTQSTLALRDSPSELREALGAIQSKRLFAHGELEHEWDKVQRAHTALDALLQDQTAYYTQHQLLGFLTSPRRYARNPENIAGAMAGLPEYSASYSYQRCAKHPPQSKHATVEIFKVIARCWDRAYGSRDELIAILPTTIRALSTDHVRMQLEAEWWYLREAIQSIPRTVEVEAVPFLVFSEYQNRRVRQTPETMVFAKDSRLDAQRVEVV